MEKDKQIYEKLYPRYHHKQKLQSQYEKVLKQSVINIPKRISHLAEKDILQLKVASILQGVKNKQFRLILTQPTEQLKTVKQQFQKRIKVQYTQMISFLNKQLFTKLRIKIQPMFNIQLISLYLTKLTQINSKKAKIQINPDAIDYLCKFIEKNQQKQFHQITTNFLYYCFKNYLKDDVFLQNRLPNYVSREFLEKTFQLYSQKKDNKKIQQDKAVIFTEIKDLNVKGIVRMNLDITNFESYLKSRQNTQEIDIKSAKQIIKLELYLQRAKNHSNQQGFKKIKIIVQKIEVKPQKIYPVKSIYNFINQMSLVYDSLQYYANKILPSQKYKIKITINLKSQTILQDDIYLVYLNLENQKVIILYQQKYQQEYNGKKSIQTRKFIITDMKQLELPQNLYKEIKEGTTIKFIRSQKSQSQYSQFQTTLEDKIYRLYKSKQQTKYIKCMTVAKRIFINYRIKQCIQNFNFYKKQLTIQGQGKSGSLQLSQLKLYE